MVKLYSPTCSKEAFYTPKIFFLFPIATENMAVLLLLYFYGQNFIIIFYSRNLEKNRITRLRESEL